MKRRILAKSAAAFLALSIVSFSSFSIFNIEGIQNISIASEATTKYDPMGLVQKGEGFELSLDQFKVLTGLTGDHENLAGYKVKSVSVKEVKITDAADAEDAVKTNTIDGGKKLALFVEKEDGTKDIFVMLSETKSGEKPARITEVKNKDGSTDYVVSKVKAKLGAEEEKEFPGGFKISLAKDVAPVDNKYTVEAKIGLKVEGAEAEVKDSKIVFSGNKTLEVKFPEKTPPAETPSEQKVYKVPVKMVKTDKDELAKGASSIITNAIVVEKDGKSKIYIDTVPQELTDQYGFIMKMYSFETDLNSAKHEAKLHQTAKYIEAADSGKENPEGPIKPKMFIIERNTVGENQIFIDLESDVKDVFEAPARLVFDYDKKEEIKESDIPNNATVVVSKKKPEDPTKKPSTTSNKPASTTTPANRTTTTPTKTKLPQTGSPINTAVLISLGIVSVIAGTYIYKKK